MPASGTSQPSAAEKPLEETPPSSDEERWWRSFDDPTLARLVEQALHDNLDLHMAWARISQAQAMARTASAARYPQISAQGEANWNRSLLGFLGAADQTTLRGSIPVSYEVDWFAKNAGTAEAARLDVQAARADVEAAAISVTAQIAEAWFDVLEARERTRLLHEDVLVNQEVLELVKLRFKQGLSPALDAHQQRQHLATTRARMQLAEMNERNARSRLSVLLGEFPRGQPYDKDRQALPALPSAPDVGMPANLLEQRPDVRAAARRLQAADERVAVAVASRLPTLMLNGSVGYAWTKFAPVNDSSSSDADTTGGAGAQNPLTSKIGKWQSAENYAAGAVLSIPLFDGLLRRGQLDQSRAKVREAMENHERVLLQAMLEVDTALVSERDQGRRIEMLNEQLSAARDTLQAAGDRYQKGLAEFLNFLNALDNEQQTELAVLAARREQLSYRIQLHRALGGHWTRELDAPSSEEKQP